jgi:hypothetical protein
MSLIKVKNPFKVGDTIINEYLKGIVVEVTSHEYEVEEDDESFCDIYVKVLEEYGKGVSSFRGSKFSLCSRYFKLFASQDEDNEI